MTNPASDRMIIRMTKKQTFPCQLRFEVRVQIELAGHQVGWTMDVLWGCGFRSTSIQTNNSSSSLTARNFWFTAAGWTAHFFSRSRKKKCSRLKK
jgi:hypothetical protein